MQVYAKTGTGRVDGHNVNGWFVGHSAAIGGSSSSFCSIELDK